MAKTCFSVIDIIVTAISLCSFVLDVVTDATVCVQYFGSGLVLWGWMTLALTVVPAIIMNIFSLAWHIHDKTVNSFTVICHVLLLAPVQRYINVLYLGVKSRQSRKVVVTQSAFRAQNDVSILRLFEAFMESAPQLILQLFIIVHHCRINWFTGLSASASFLSLSWALTAYSDSLRRACKSGYQRRITGLLLHWAWQLFMALSRIAAFVVFAYVFHTWVFVFMVIHWLLSFVWICVQGTDFGSGQCEKWMFRGVCAFIYIFMFLNLNDGMSRYRITAFYVVITLENAAMVTLYLLIGEGDYPVLACTVVFGGFLIGLICMGVYYNFLHPTKPASKLCVPRLSRSTPTRFKHSSPGEGSNKSSTIQGHLPIFSIDSPQSIPVMDGTSVNLSMPNASHNLTKSASQSCRSSNSAFSIPLKVHETLKHKWQSGMISSSTSSSSSSLESDTVGVEMKKVERPSSRASENSNESERSNNCLLVPESKNNLNKSISSSPKRKHKSLHFIDKISNDDPSFSVDKNVFVTESPSLSRCSWARSSDDTRQSLGMEEFVTLGFDCSSSIERRVSDNSSFNSRPKSLSPLNVSNLWHDARGKLRQTIAATVAAAMCNPSSNEGTPNNSQSFVSQATSSQDESVSSLSHNFGFMDSKSSYHDKDRISTTGSVSLNSGKHREALSFLPDISESAENEQLSDFSYDPSVKKSPEEENPASPLFNSDEFRQLKGSPYHEDSTLTASKLGQKAVTPVSYLAAQHRMQSSQDSRISVQSTDFINSTPAGSEQRGSSSKKRYNPDGSPFTDQELTSVMAKSLQSYTTGASSSTDSNNKEREGLALTLEDLEYPIDLEAGEPDDQVSKSLYPKDSLTKSRSTSSLFHDADDSSPASSASKMQRVADLKRPDSEISPNAFKHLDLSPSFLMHQTKSPVIDTKVIKELHLKLGSPKNSEALKILMEAYGQLSTRSPQVQTPDHTKLSVHRKNSDIGTPRRKDQNVIKDIPGKLSGVKRMNPELQLFNESQSEYMEIKKGPTQKNIELFDSIAWQKSKLKAKQQFHENTQAYAGQSSTKKLNVHSNKHVFELSDSPNLRSCRKSSPEDNVSIKYVEGKYCPPLCKSSSEMEEESILNNFNLNQSSSYKSHSPKKGIPANSVNNTSLTSSRHSTSSLHQRPVSLQKVNLRRSLRQPESDYFHLHANDRSRKPKTLRPVQQDPLDTYFDNSWDINEAGLFAESPLSYSRHQRSLQSSESSGQKDIYPYPVSAELELKMSAKQVENYFSRALEQVPVVSKTNASHSDLDVPSPRRPLKSLQNSPQHIPPQALQYPPRQSQQFRNDDFVDRRRNISAVKDRRYSGASRRLSLDGKFI